MPPSAYADATAFLGASATPVNRPVKGFAVGIGLLMLGFEFEYAESAENLAEAAPSLRTGMGNVLLQPPFPIAGLQFYVTAGAGGYREQLGNRRETFVGLNSGGGVKITIAGPIRVRLDYRVFSLRGRALHPTVQRVYAGVNLVF
jgi:opacity protein-like surface antigen